MEVRHMKQHHLYLQSLNGVVLHLMSKLILLCLFMGGVSVKASDKSILPPYVKRVRHTRFISKG